MIILVASVILTLIIIAIACFFKQRHLRLTLKTLLYRFGSQCIDGKVNYKFCLRFKETIRSFKLFKDLIDSTEETELKKMVEGNIPLKVKSILDSLFSTFCREFFSLDIKEKEEFISSLQ